MSAERWAAMIHEHEATIKTKRELGWPVMHQAECECGWTSLWIAVKEHAERIGKEHFDLKRAKRGRAWLRSNGLYCERCMAEAWHRYSDGAGDSVAALYEQLVEAHWCYRDHDGDREDDEPDFTSDPDDPTHPGWEP